MKKFNTALVASIFMGAASVSTAAEKEPKLIEEFSKNITCTNDGNGAFSFWMKSYDKPIISVLKSFYSFDSNHVVLSFYPEKNPGIYKGSIIDNPSARVSEEFKDVFKDFNGRLLMFFDKHKGKNYCSIETDFPKINTVSRIFTPRVDKKPDTPAPKQN